MDDLSVTSIRLLLLAGLLMYFAPCAILVGRRKRNATAIVWLNILAGWTVIGWLVALIWALMKDAEPTVIVQSRER